VGDGKEGGREGGAGRVGEGREEKLREGGEGFYVQYAHIDIHCITYI
jgi:hypothetical protein